MVQPSDGSGGLPVVRETAISFISAIFLARALLVEASSFSGTRPVGCSYQVPPQRGPAQSGQRPVLCHSDRARCGPDCVGCLFG